MIDKIKENKLIISLLILFVLFSTIVFFNKSNKGSYLYDSQTSNPILIFGDSLSAGYKLDKENIWSERLESKLKNEGIIRVDQSVLNLSVSGRTSGEGLDALPEALEANPKLVVIQLGANDALRRQSMDKMRSNLSEMINLSKKSGAKVILVGVKPTGILGFATSNTFLESYPILAKEHDVILLENLFDDLSSSDMLDDKLHPNNNSQEKIAETVYPYILKASKY